MYEYIYVGHILPLSLTFSLVNRRPLFMCGSHFENSWELRSYNLDISFRESSYCRSVIGQDGT